MHVNVTETPIIPYDIDRYYIYGSNRATISVCGDVVGPIFPTMPVNATSLLNLPMVPFLVLGHFCPRRKPLHKINSWDLGWSGTNYVRFCRHDLHDYVYEVD